MRVMTRPPVLPDTHPGKGKPLDPKSQARDRHE